jgi:drug/metabolite transporter (DMT)-like permease
MMRAAQTGPVLPMPPPASRRNALIALVLLTLVWSYNWIVMKQVLQYTGPFHFVAWRATLACGVLFLILILRRESLRPPPWLPTLLIGLAQIAVFAILIQWALVEGGAGKTALLTYTMPFWVVLLARVTLAEHMSPRQWMYIGLAALGLLCVIEPWHGISGIRSTLMAMGAGLCWAISVVISKRLFARTNVSPLSLTAWQMLFGAAVLIVAAAFVPEREIEWTPYFIGALAYNAVLASGIAWLLWAYIVQRLPATIAGMTSLAVPLCGVLFAWALLGEKPTPVESLGIVMIAIALFGITRPARG